MTDIRNDTVSDIGTSSSLDQGLRGFMSAVYGFMSVAMVITGVVAFLVGNSPSLLAIIFGSPIRWIVMFAPLGVVLFMGFKMHSMSSSKAQVMLFVFSALIGLSTSYIFAAYTGMSIARVFFITAISFLSLSLYGYTTKRNLSAFGRFLFMGLVGIVLASLVNIFLQSSALGFTVSAIGVLVFAGLTAYDTQKLKEYYVSAVHYGGMSDEDTRKLAISGALTLYLDFVNMFTILLQVLGVRTGGSE